ncbi:MAG: hypothetical protein ACD_71C00067G0001 [uncultured bacterium (gcode 4)]|uniref:Uncharacterized protein n=1 Tax=uncultured bacterium (gcode 4) TaxID=1234023 RepID=K1YNX6_9BACT|nr:MAG: hypothetical protein ACD_71C00067G0001 [uncultured bacterium (gcode 4)]
MYMSIFCLNLLNLQVVIRESLWVMYSIHKKDIKARPFNLVRLAKPPIILASIHLCFLPKKSVKEAKRRYKESLYTAP